MTLSDLIPFWPDRRTYYLPWIRFRTPEGETADGPMIRQGTGRRELLAWTSADKAEAAARELTAQTGGKYDVRTVDRRGLQAACRDFAFGGRLVAVILE